MKSLEIINEVKRRQTKIDLIFFSYSLMFLAEIILASCRKSFFNSLYIFHSLFYKSNMH